MSVAGLFWSIFLLIKINATQAQDTNFLKNYHPTVNRAELAIMVGDYSQALEQYNLAFKDISSGFMKDYFNAAVCATYLGNASLTYHYLLKVASKGISLDFIKDEVAFGAIQQDSAWRTFEKQYLAEKRIFDQKINRSLKKQLDSLVLIDKKIRAKGMEFSEDTLIQTDNLNALALQKIIKKNGFPNEDLIGCGDAGMPIIQYPFYQIIKRQTPDKQTINFSNNLFEAMRKGQIAPHTATYLMASMNGNDVFFARHIFKIISENPLENKGRGFEQKVNRWVYREINVEDEQRINELRLQNGMETLEDYRKKIIFSLNDNKFLFPYRSYVGIWSVRDEKTIENYLEGTKILDEVH